MALCRESKELPPCPIGDFKLPSSFKKHPGGQAHLQVARESQCPGTLFLSYHLASDMGKVAAAANALGVAMPHRGPLFDEIYAMVSRVKAEHPRQHLVFVAWCLLLTVGLQVVLVSWLVQPNLINSLVGSQLFEMYFFNVFHTRHHKGGRLFGSDFWFLDRCFGALYDIVDNTWGYTPDAWQRNHHVKHHVYTNELEMDPDMPGSYPVIRTRQEQPLKWFHKFQTFYWPLPLPFVVMALPTWNIVMNGGKVIAFAFWFLVMVVLPFCLHGWYGLALSAVTQMVTGVNMTYKFAVSHTHQELGSEAKGSTNEAVIDQWIKAQVEEAQSWGGYISCLLYGGINMQIEHHVCPALDPTLYAFVGPELRRICEAHGIRYTYEPTALHAAWGFHYQLWLMGVGKEC